MNIRRPFARRLPFLLLATLLPATWIAAPITAHATIKTFQDVPSGYWAAKEIDALASAGVVQGLPNGNFSPSAPVTRGQFAAMLVRVEGLKLVSHGPNFKDVGKANPLRQDIETAATAGLLVGFVGGDFKPDTSINRAEASVAIARSMGIGTIAAKDFGAQSLSYQDRASIPAYAHGAVALLTSMDVVKGTSGNAFSPMVTLNRAEAAVLIYRMEHTKTDAVATAVAPAAHKVELKASSVTVNPGSATTMDVKVLDASGRVLPENVTFSATDGTMSGDTFMASKAGKAMVTARELGSSVKASTTIDVVTLTVNKLAFSSSTPKTALTGKALAITVQVENAKGQVVTSDSGRSLQLTVTTAAGAMTIPATDHNGQAIFNVPVQSHSGQVMLTVASTGLAPASTKVLVGSVTPPSSSERALTVHAVSTVTSGQKVHLQVLASSGNPKVTLSETLPDGAKQQVGAASATGGVATFTLTPKVAGKRIYTASASTYKSANPFTMQVSPGAEATLFVDAAPSSIMRVGQTISVKAAVADAYNNPTSTSAQVVVVTSGHAGTFQKATTKIGGLTTIGHVTATATGTLTLMIEPQGGSLTPQTLTIRVVKSAADVVSGAGLWMPYWVWSKLPDHKILSEAKAMSAHYLYLEVASTKVSPEFYGQRGLDDLLHKAHQDGIAVIAWTYAGLGANQSRDEQAAKTALSYTTPTGDQVDGIAPDLEQNLTASSLSSYLKTVRSYSGQRPVVAVTYSPEASIHTPYAAISPYATVIAPMDYWHVQNQTYSTSAVASYVSASVHAIHQIAPQEPVQVIAQDFSVFGSSAQPTATEEQAAQGAAQIAGASGISYYQVGTFTLSELKQMEAFRWP